MTFKNRNRLTLLSLLAILLTILLAVVPACYATDKQIIEAIDDHAEAFSSIATADLDNFLDRVGDARLVLLGESTHGTQEFYEMRARISQALIEQKGFNIIALEGDWPDASRIEHYIQSDSRPPLYRRQPFSSFTRWMWVNQPFIEFTRWLKDVNEQRDDDDRIHISGLDLYNMAGSMRLVLGYLRTIDPESAEYAWQQYRCLLPIADNPGKYGDYANTGRYPVCKKPVEAVYQMFLDKAEAWSVTDPDRYFNARQNALLAVNGEYFFRLKFSYDTDSDRDAWNYREQNLMESLQRLMEHHGDSGKVIIWAHNTHVGDSRATDMAEDDRHSLGERVRTAFPEQCYLVGFATEKGTVTAAPGWNESAQIMQVPASHAGSFEHLFSMATEDNFMLPMRTIRNRKLKESLSEEHGQRAIGVSYDPANEMEKHYVGARLAEQFDELIWFHRTSALRVKP